MMKRLIPVYLFALMAYVMAGTPIAPFHGDESTLIYTSRDYFDQFVAKDLPRVTNQRTDDGMDHNLRLLDGRVQKYLGGFAFHLTGGSAEALNAPWLWGADAQFNLDDGHVPNRDVLMAQRWAMALLLALSVPAAYGIGAQVGGISGGLLMATLIAVSPNLVLNGRRVMMEAPLLLFSLLAALAALRIAANVRPVAGGTPTAARSRFSAALFYALFGLGAGMALASKHSALFGVTALFGALGVFMLWGRHWRGLAGIVAAGVLASAVFFAFNPAWWVAPLDTVSEVLRLRSSLLGQQTAAFGGYESAAEYVEGFVDYAVLERPQYYEVLIWEEIGPTIAEYESSPWVLSPAMNAVRATLVTLLAAWGAVVLARRRDGMAWVAGVWILLTLFSVLLLTPLPWARYYLPALPAIYTLAAAGIGAIRLPSRGQP